ncbi:ATP-binding cassette domain-containing protein, partial [Klebsiella pneumoniae]|uniref:ATP-binding cassette domain-containing protein n=1 Tax=Klebsiella pneumoniae TaxID=573 RepID=UPI001D0DB590
MQPDEGLFTRQLPGDRFREQTDPVLQLENINVSFDGFRALTDLSLAIGVGELRCVIGPNGAGKTTLMDVITGKTRPQSGKALYDQSVDLTTLDPVAIARQGIGRKFQKPTVFEALTVALVVCVLLAVLNRFTNPQYYWSGWVALIWGALLVVRGLR